MVDFKELSNAQVHSPEVKLLLLQKLGGLKLESIKFDDFFILCDTSLPRLQSGLSVSLEQFIHSVTLDQNQLSVQCLKHLYGLALKKTLRIL